MNLVGKFQINQGAFIEILIPDTEDKFNYYYEPNNALHMFDEVTVILKKGNAEITLEIDHINEIVQSLRKSLQLTLANECQLPEQITLGELGICYNKNVSARTHNQIDYHRFWLFSLPKGPQTWLYSQDKKIYLEIVPSYPWLYSDLEEEQKKEGFIPFDEFMKTYKPIFVGEISQETAQHWIMQCDKILASMVMVKP